MWPGEEQELLRMGSVEAPSGLGYYRGSTAAKAEFESDVNYHPLVSNTS